MHPLPAAMFAKLKRSATFSEDFALYSFRHDESEGRKYIYSISLRTVWASLSRFHEAHVSSTTFFVKYRSQQNGMTYDRRFSLLF